MSTSTELATQQSDDVFIINSNNASRSSTRNNSTDSLIILNETMPVAVNPPKIGLKLVLKRHSGSDKYEIKNLSSSGASQTSQTGRPKRAAARKVKFTFNENDYEVEDPSMLRKRAKTIRKPPVEQIPRVIITKKPLNSVQPVEKQQVIYRSEAKETLIAFEVNELQPKLTIDEKIRIVKNQPSVVIEHSRPFPIALVEDKSNVVYTKAVLFLHLFRSYASPCINCPWCKRFLSVGEFSKHIHADDLEDEEEDSSDDNTDLDPDSNSDDEAILKKRLSKRLAKLKLKSFKILPYCTSGTDSDGLSESDIKTWKLFGDRFSHFKQLRAQYQKKLKEFAALVKKQEEDKSAQQMLNRSHQVFKPNLLTNLSASWSVQSPFKQDTATKKTFTDWDQINEEKKEFLLNKSKIDCEKITYLNKNGSALSDSDEEESKEENNKQLPAKKKYDFSLSEDEDESDDVETVKESSQKSINSLDKSSQTIEHEKEQIQLPVPTLQQRQFNLYDNLSKETLSYMIKNQFTILPTSFVAYNTRKREIKLKRLMLAKSYDLKIDWLKSCLNLECK